MANKQSEKPTFTKQELIERVHNAVGGKKKEAILLVDTFFEMIKESLASGQTVKLSSFGIFEVRDKKARPGRNPQTKERITIAPRRVVVFRPSQVLRDRINGKKRRRRR